MCEGESLYKRIVIGVGIVVGVLAIAAPIAASLNWAKKQYLAEQQQIGRAHV